MLGKVMKENRAYLAPLLAAMIVAGIFISINTKAELHLAVNRFHNPVADRGFMILTFLGNGLTAAGLVLLLFLVRVRYGMTMLAAWILSGLIAQLLKHLVFPGALRPVALLQDYDLYLVPGIKTLHHFSFPSGHATTACAVFLVLAGITRRNALKVLAAVLAILTAFSRVYLSQHFMEDVLAGSVLGTVTALVCIPVLERIKTGWSEKPLLYLVASPRKNENGD